MIGRLKRSINKRCPECKSILQIRVREIGKIRNGIQVTIQEEYITCSNRNCDYEREIEQKRIRRQDSPEQLEFTLPAEDGTRHFDCRIVPEWGPGGAVATVLTVARDVTDRWLAFDAERRARAVAEAPREATVVLTRSLDRESVLVTLLDRLRRMVPFDRARVMLVEGASRLSVRAVFDGDRAMPLSAESRTELDATDHPIVHDILTTGAAVLIPDTRAHPGWSLPTDRASEVSWMGVPLFAESQACSHSE